MECLRCQGLMVEDHFVDFEGTPGFLWTKGWRCMNCGYVADAVIEANHRLHETTGFMRSFEEGEREPEQETNTRVAA